MKPYSAARANAAGAPQIERVDRIVQLIAAEMAMRNDTVDAVVATVDGRVSANTMAAA